MLNNVLSPSALNISGIGRRMYSNRHFNIPPLAAIMNDITGRFLSLFRYIRKKDGPHSPTFNEMLDHSQTTEANPSCPPLCSAAAIITAWLMSMNHPLATCNLAAAVG
jgi:hypothetical protein